MHTKLAVSDNLLTSPVGKDLVGLEDYYYLLRKLFRPNTFGPLSHNLVIKYISILKYPKGR